MSLFKCKMCGGSLEIITGTTVVQCEYCGTKQTLPRLSDERITNLYDRANHFRRNNDYDKALSFYEQILSEDRSDSEAYWSIVLCRYGIEYVEDPATRRRIPTINRAQYTSIFSDEDYKSAILYADDAQKVIYEQEAKEIDDIQKGILEVSRSEDPFDVFICYKETDNNGRRTPDSVLATDLYNELTREGYKVFFSRITLEDKLGQEYEPIIFAALNSARVMVVLGTKPEHFNAVWVKNEWSRYLSLIRNGKRNTLIPAYKDMDPYDLPEAFSHLQAQDMSKLGFMQDLVHGIKKILSDGKVAEKRESTANGGNSIEATIDYALLLIEDGNTQKAQQLLEQVVCIAPKHPMIYVAKLLIERGVRKQEDLARLDDSFDNSPNYEKAVRFANPQLRATLEGYAEAVNKNGVKSVYDQAVAKMNTGTTAKDFAAAKKLFDSISDFKDAGQLSLLCSDKAEAAKKEVVYQHSLVLMNSETNYRLAALEKAIDGFESIKDYKDSTVQRDTCERLLYAEKETLAAKKRKKNTLIKILILIILAAVLFSIIFFGFILPRNNYNKAEKLFDEQNYSAAYDIYSKLGSYKDSSEKAMECLYIQATALRAEKRWDEANALFEKIWGYKDSAELFHAHNYEVIASENATCAKNGYKDYKCSDCGQTYRANIAATGKHEYKVVNSRNATCEAGGFKEYKCSTCDRSYRDDIKAIGHNYSSATCTKAKTCKNCGKTSGSALGHTTDTAKCSRCGTITFKTITYSGKGSEVKNNITLPHGTFRFTCTMTSGNDNVTMYFSDGTTGYQPMIFCDYVAGTSEVTVIKGPVNNGSIVINANGWGGSKMGWKIVIEAIG
ncbi:MAG: TIR domain-containing protein [Clostridia bacterium]|nr:TIR domain-containing protein [Clostridia bacterium]